MTADGPQKIQELAKNCKKKQEELALQGQRKVKRATSFGIDSDEDNSDAGTKKVSSNGKATAAAKNISREASSSAAGRGRGRGRGRAVSSKQSKSTASASRSRKKKRGDSGDELSDEDDEDVDDIDEILENDDLSDISERQYSKQRKAASAAPAVASRKLPSRGAKERAVVYLDGDSDDEDIKEVSVVPPTRSWPIADSSTSSQTKAKNVGTLVASPGGGGKKRPMPFDNKQGGASASTKNKAGAASFTENWD